MITSSRLILVDNALPVAAPTFVDPDDSLAIHTRLLHRFLADAGARRRARRRALRKAQATGDVACVSFSHGPAAQPPRACSAP
jgi:hypothetical protein